MTEAIGGYFELELRQGKHYHKGAILLNTARNCFEYILLARKYTKVFIPYYTCEVMLQPLKRHNIAYEFYSINEGLEPISIKKLLSNEAFLYTNYFGLKQRCIENLATVYGSQLIVDNAQAFFAPRLASIDTFYSPRKFFGVPDGGYLYTDCVLELDFPQDKSYGRMQHLLQRIDEDAESGYSFFRANDDLLDDNPIRKMSCLTQKILCNIDYEYVKKVRLSNFFFFHGYLYNRNGFSINIMQDDIPMVYPYIDGNNFLRKKLITNNIYIAQYWNNILAYLPKDSIEERLVNSLIPLPIDQRYMRRCLQNVINLII